MLESVGVSHMEPLSAERFILMPLEVDGVARVAAMVEADYLVRDPGPGKHQEVLRFNK